MAPMLCPGGRAGEGGGGGGGREARIFHGAVDLTGRAARRYSCDDTAD